MHRQFQKLVRIPTEHLVDGQPIEGFQDEVTETLLRTLHHLHRDGFSKQLTERREEVRQEDHIVARVNNIDALPDLIHDLDPSVCVPLLKLLCKRSPVHLPRGGGGGKDMKLVSLLAGLFVGWSLC